jgi:hypothetical protein
MWVLVVLVELVSITPERIMVRRVQVATSGMALLRELHFPATVDVVVTTQIMV